MEKWYSDTSITDGLVSQQEPSIERLKVLHKQIFEAENCIHNSQKKNKYSNIAVTEKTSTESLTWKTKKQILIVLSSLWMQMAT